jgi:hypothetical protein
LSDIDSERVEALVASLSDDEVHSVLRACEARLGWYFGGWGIDDLLSHYEMTKGQAEEWFAEHGRHLSENCCEAGWIYIEEFCPYPQRSDDELEGSDDEKQGDIINANQEQPGPDPSRA